MYEALDVAKYVVQYCNEKKYPISNLRLQKLLYFIQATFIQEKNELCFRDDMECWEYGPVCPEVYSFFRRFGSSSIPFEKFYTVYNRVSNQFIKEIFDMKFNSAYDKELIDSVIEQLRGESVYRLVEITHKQKPWLENYKHNFNNKISKESMVDYFGK